MPGRVISHAKTHAAKVNGAKSGRPRKTSVEAARIYLASDPDCFAFFSLIKVKSQLFCLLKEPVDSMVFCGV
jgi:hypothetical protein